MFSMFKLVLNPHGSDETAVIYTHVKLNMHVLNPHGSDETCGLICLSSSSASLVLNPHGSDETVNVKLAYYSINVVLNPHGSDETKRSFFKKISPDRGS